MQNKVSRRTFFKSFVDSGQRLAAATVTAPMALSVLADEKTPDLAVVKGNPVSATKKAIELLGGMDQFVRQGSQVLLKPNISFPNPASWGTTTNPEVVKTVARMSLDAGAKRVFVADNMMREGDRCFSRTGFTEAFADMPQVKLLALKRESLFEEVEVPYGKALQKIKVAKLLKRCDVVINMPCAKSHVATQVSFGLKNLMGLIWDRDYLHQSTDLHAAIAELITVIRPDLTILDATRALLNNGPTGPGKVQELNTVIAGLDPLAVDGYATGLTTWNNRSLVPKTIKHLVEAEKRGVGMLDLDKVKIVQAEV